jgi:hypothetical protein
MWNAVVHDMQRTSVKSLINMCNCFKTGRSFARRIALVRFKIYVVGAPDVDAHVMLPIEDP